MLVTEAIGGGKLRTLWCRQKDNSRRRGGHRVILGSRWQDVVNVKAVVMRRSCVRARGALRKQAVTRKGAAVEE